MHSKAKLSKYQLLFIVVSLAFGWASLGAAHAKQALQPKTNKNCLWEIQTKKNTVYLLGSLHILTKDCFPLSRQIEDAYRSCNKVVFETDIGAMNDPATQANMMALALYPNGQTLQQNVSNKTYSRFKAKVEAAGLPMPQFERFRPWLCGLTLAVLELQRLGFDLNLGVDKYFYNKAQGDEKEIDFLEPVEYQLDLLAGMNKSDQEAFLSQMLKDLEVIEKMSANMLNSWKTGNVEQLDSIIKISFKQHPAILDRLLIQRNKNWVPIIEELMKQDENVLIVAGAGHMVGADGVVDLLKKRGYRIEQK